MPPHSLPSDLARRLLARAAELDARAAADVPVARLREAAREAGISDAAFDAALREADAPEPPREPVDRLAVNVLAFALFWLVLGAWSRFARTTPMPSEVDAVVRALLTALGALAALRLRARGAALVLAVGGTAMLVEAGAQLVYGRHVLNNSPAHWGLMAAALLGIAFGVLLVRAPRGGGALGAWVRRLRAADARRRDGWLLQLH